MKFILAFIFVLFFACSANAAGDVLTLKRNQAELQGTAQSSNHPANERVEVRRYRGRLDTARSNQTQTQSKRTRNDSQDEDRVQEKQLKRTKETDYVFANHEPDSLLVEILLEERQDDTIADNVASSLKSTRRLKYERRRQLEEDVENIRQRIADEVRIRKYY